MNVLITGRATYNATVQLEKRFRRWLAQFDTEGVLLEMIGPDTADNDNDFDYSLAAAAAHSSGSDGASATAKASSSGHTSENYHLAAFNHARDRDRTDGPAAARRWFPGGSHVGVKSPQCWHKRCELSDTFRDVVKIVMAKLNESQSAVARHFSNIGHVFMTQGTCI